MSDALEDIFEKDKATEKLFKADCPGYVWQGPANPVQIVGPHMYMTRVDQKDRKESYVCEDCARLYSRDDRLRGFRE